LERVAWLVGLECASTRDCWALEEVRRPAWWVAAAARGRTAIPNWVFNLAGGLTGPLPFGSMKPGHYKLTVYAWDWKGNTSALDYWFNFPLGATASAARDEFGPLNPKYDP
jgi:hypothetical protein